LHRHIAGQSYRSAKERRKFFVKIRTSNLVWPRPAWSCRSVGGEGKSLGSRLSDRWRRGQLDRFLRAE
jgi:hypothetical protein